MYWSVLLVLKDRPTKTCWTKLLTNLQEYEAAFRMSTAQRRVTHGKQVMFLGKCTFTGMCFMIFISIYSNYE